MCEQTVGKQQQQTQTEQARTLIKSKLSKQTVKRKATRRVGGKSLAIKCSGSSLFSLTLSLSGSPPCSFHHSAVCALVCVSICKQTRSPQLIALSRALSRSHAHCAYSRSTHENFPNNYPYMRASLLVWIVCGLHASRSHTGFMNEHTFVGQLSLSVRSFCLHLGFCPPLVAVSCALCACSTRSCSRSCNLKLNIDLNNVLCIVPRRVASFIVVYFLFFLFVVKFNVFGGCVCATWVVCVVCVCRKVTF